MARTHDFSHPEIGKEHKKHRICMFLCFLCSCARLSAWRLSSFSGVNKLTIDQTRHSVLLPWKTDDIPAFGPGAGSPLLRSNGCNGNAAAANIRNTSPRLRTVAVWTVFPPPLTISIPASRS